MFAPRSWKNISRCSCFVPKMHRMWMAQSVIGALMYTRFKTQLEHATVFSHLHERCVLLVKTLACSESKHPRKHPYYVSIPQCIIHHSSFTRHLECLRLWINVIKHDHYFPIFLMGALIYGSLPSYPWSPWSLRAFLQKGYHHSGCPMYIRTYTYVCINNENSI